MLYRFPMTITLITFFLQIQSSDEASEKHANCERRKWMIVNYVPDLHFHNSTRRRPGSPMLHYLALDGCRNLCRSRRYKDFQRLRTLWTAYSRSILQNLASPWGWAVGGSVCCWSFRSDRPTRGLYESRRLLLASYIGRSGKAVWLQSGFARPGGSLRLLPTLGAYQAGPKAKQHSISSLS